MARFTDGEGPTLQIPKASGGYLMVQDCDLGRQVEYLGMPATITNIGGGGITIETPVGTEVTVSGHQLTILA